MIKVASHILVTIGAAYFVYKGAGLATAIVVSYLLVALSFVEVLFSSYKEKIAFLTEQNSTKNELVGQLTDEVRELRKEIEDLRVYSSRHERWLEEVSRGPGASS